MVARQGRMLPTLAEQLQTVVTISEELGAVREVSKQPTNNSTTPVLELMAVVAVVVAMGTSQRTPPATAARVATALNGMLLTEAAEAAVERVPVTLQVPPKVLVAVADSMALAAAVDA